jgi:hypothetical protein
MPDLSSRHLLPAAGPAADPVIGTVVGQQPCQSLNQPPGQSLHSRLSQVDHQARHGAVMVNWSCKALLDGRVVHAHRNSSLA